MRAVGHAGEHTCCRPYLDVRTNGHSQRWSNERVPLAAGQSAKHRQAFRHDKHSGTTFIACHFANLGYDLTRLGQVLDRHPNLYADIGARYAETAPIPRFAAKFYAQYADRLVYGTDMGVDKEMYRVTFRVLETW